MAATTTPPPLPPPVPASHPQAGLTEAIAPVAALVQSLPAAALATVAPLIQRGQQALQNTVQAAVAPVDAATAQARDALSGAQTNATLGVQSLIADGLAAALGQGIGLPDPSALDLVAAQLPGPPVPSAAPPMPSGAASPAAPGPQSPTAPGLANPAQPPAGAAPPPGPTQAPQQAAPVSSPPAPTPAGTQTVVLGPVPTEGFGAPGGLQMPVPHPVLGGQPPAAPPPAQGAPPAPPPATPPPGMPPVEPSPLEPAPPAPGAPPATGAPTPAPPTGGGAGECVQVALCTDVSGRDPLGIGLTDAWLRTNDGQDWFASLLTYLGPGLAAVADADTADEIDALLMAAPGAFQEYELLPSQPTLPVAFSPA